MSNDENSIENFFGTMSAVAALATSYMPITQPHPMFDPDYKLGKHRFRIKRENFTALSEAMKASYDQDIATLVAKGNKTELRPWRGLGPNGEVKRLFYPLGFAVTLDEQGDIVGFKALKNRSPYVYSVFIETMAFVEPGSWYDIRFSSQTVRMVFKNGNCELFSVENPFIPDPSLHEVNVVVSKHPAIVDLYRERGYKVCGDILVVLPAVPDDPKEWGIFEGANVLTTEPLPLEVLNRCAMIASIPLALPLNTLADLRLALLRKAAGPVYAHNVTRQLAVMFYQGKGPHSEWALRNGKGIDITDKIADLKGVLTTGEIHQWTTGQRYVRNESAIPMVAARLRAYLDSLEPASRAEKVKEYQAKYTTKFMEQIEQATRAPRTSAEKVREAHEKLSKMLATMHTTINDSGVVTTVGESGLLATEFIPVAAPEEKTSTPEPDAVAQYLMTATDEEMQAAIGSVIENILGQPPADAVSAATLARIDEDIADAHTGRVSPVPPEWWREDLEGSEVISGGDAPEKAREHVHVASDRDREIETLEKLSGMACGGLGVPVVLAGIALERMDDAVAAKKPSAE